VHKLIARIIYSGVLKVRRRLHVLKNSGGKKYWSTWEEIDQHFFALSQGSGLNHFRRDEIVIETMEYQDIDAWNFAQEASRIGIIEPTLGKPYKPFKNRNSLNLGHQFRHLRKWATNPSEELSKVDRVVEFGAGFGMMCWIVFQLGFDKDYVIVDNGGTSSLQKRYLEATLTEEQFQKIRWVKTLEELTPHLGPADLFIAMWSVSETPDATLEKVLVELQERKPRLLFAYQEEFKGRNNSEFINRFSIQGSMAKVENWPSFYLWH
jgi:hypothetical protein